MDADRRRSIAAIHAAASNLGLDTADKNPGSPYRTILRVQGGGKVSSSDMSDAERKRVLAYLLRQSNRGKVAVHKDGWQVAKIEALWADLGTAGALRDPTPAGLQAFIFSRFKVNAARWLTAVQASQVIEALKAWKARGAAAE
ncbi:MAG: regulatory protein GemA [Rubrivivax sp.]|nr:regulatory protein GemA [Rubrivivax sp.]MDP3615440.1 regulatory protein GemA [Rubrivivax sp.]